MIQKNIISHHGIQGMHWGEQNGPPYPLTTEAKQDAGYTKKEKKQDTKYVKSAGNALADAARYSAKRYEKFNKKYAKTSEKLKERMSKDLKNIKPDKTGTINYMPSDKTVKLAEKVSDYQTEAADMLKANQKAMHTYRTITENYLKKYGDTKINEYSAKAYKDTGAEILNGTAMRKVKNVSLRAAVGAARSAGGLVGAVPAGLAYYNKLKKEDNIIKNTNIFENSDDYNRYTSKKNLNKALRIAAW